MFGMDIKIDRPDISQERLVPIKLEAPETLQICVKKQCVVYVLIRILAYANTGEYLHSQVNSV